MAEATGHTKQARVFKRDEVLLKEGEVASAVFLLDAGRVALLRKDKEVGQMSDGALIGAVGALLSQPQLFTVKSLAHPTIAREYTVHDLQHAFTADAKLLLAVFRALEVEAHEIEARAQEDAFVREVDAEKDTTSRIMKARTILKNMADRVVLAVERQER